MDNKKFRFCKAKGFTLIEVIIAVSIVVILASLTLPKVTGYIDRAKIAKVLNAGKQVYTATMWSYSDQGNTISEDKIKNAVADSMSLGTVPTVDLDADNKSVTIKFTIDNAECIVEIVFENSSYTVSKDDIEIFDSNEIAIGE
jgi:type IV pilus assembly protein PilA